MHTIGITGGTGFIGQHLTALLVSKGYDVVIFTRSAARKTDKHVTYAHWDVEKRTCDINPLKELDAVVNLAGEGLADKRLTDKRKQLIIDSRVKSTEFLLGKLREYSPHCKTLVSASAIGYYGPDREGAVPFTETAAPYTDFLGDTCRLWESASQKGNEFLRTVIIRMGIVLGKDGGAYPRFARPVSLGIMPILGPGTQMVSWIAIDDLARLFLYALEHDEISGTYNAVAPDPVSQWLLIRTIAKVKGGIRIPTHIPAFVLEILLGEMSSEVLKSCTVSAQKTLGSGFTFHYADITSAIQVLN